MTTTTPSFFSMGKETFQVPLSLFRANRDKLVTRLRQAAGGHCRGGDDVVVVFLTGGPSETRFDSDHEPLFRQESYFWYLTGVKEPDCRVAIEVASKKVTLFVPKLPPSYATIMGRIRTLPEWKEHYQVDEVLYTDDVYSAIATMLGGEEKTSNNGTTNGYKPHGASTKSKLLLMKGRNSDSGKLYEPPQDMIEKFSSKDKSRVDVDTDTLFSILAECRVVKNEAEKHLLRHVTELTSWAHAYVMRHMMPGMMEYQAESLFRHYCYYNYGSRLVGYTPICGCGPNAATLHYGHAGEPNARPITEGDMCLFDMGAEYFGYGSDVTCSFPSTGQFDPKQRAIYLAVLQAQRAVYDRMRPGVSWVDCHKAAEAEILQALIDIGLVILLPDDKTVEDLVELRLGAVFMPHGLGHLIGIDTHDVGGYLPGHPARSTLPGLESLRTARRLQKDMTLTVEPGCYFIDHLLDEALAENSPLRMYLNADAIDEYRGFGGVRLEDVVVVTDDGCINYTLCPRTIREVEHVMAGGKWPPMKDEAPELRRERLTATTPLPSPPSL